MRRYELIVKAGKLPSDFMVVTCLLAQQGVRNDSVAATEQTFVDFMRPMCQERTDGDGSKFYATPEYGGNVGTCYIDGTCGRP